MVRATILFTLFIASITPVLLHAEASANAKHLKKTETAAEIMLKVDQRYTGDTQIANSVLTLIDKKDRQRTRELKMYRLEKDAVEKSIIVFLSPSDVSGTSYLSFDWEDETKEDDAWLYLPALHQPRRVAATDESGSFMGSDFSYSDINGIDYEDFDYELLKASEIIDGHDCWVIKSIPKNDKIIKKTGYLESTSWVRKDIYIVVQSKISVKKGRRIKYFSAKNLKDIDGIWTATTLQMITTRNDQKEHASLLQFGEIIYNKSVDESLFDTTAMQRGLQ